MQQADFEGQTKWTANQQQRTGFTDGLASGTDGCREKRQRTTRNSGIELLKLFAILVIVTSHVVQTLRQGNALVPYQDYLLDVSKATTDPAHFILALFSHFGVLGNTIFFVCSAWFLLESDSYKKKKWFFMLVEVWVVSVVILTVTIVIRHGEISRDFILKSFFPTTYANNWYLTCYLLFYPIHPLLNKAIYSLDKQHLFRVSSAMFVIYCCLNFFRGWFFPSLLILWVTIYFVVAYFKLWLKDFSDSVWKNALLALVCVAGFVGITFATNLLGLHIGFFSDKLLYWLNNCHPCLIVLSIALFNCMRRIDFRSRVINYISSLSLLIYIIHENIILRTYFRPALWHYVYQKYGYDHILLCVAGVVAVVFMFGVFCAHGYDRTVRRYVRQNSDRMYGFLKRRYLRIETWLLKIQ